MREDKEWYVYIIRYFSPTVTFWSIDITNCFSRIGGKIKVKKGKRKKMSVFGFNERKTDKWKLK